jgi:hypothetical protein
VSRHWCSSRGKPVHCCHRHHHRRRRRRHRHRTIDHCVAVTTALTAPTPPPPTPPPSLRMLTPRAHRLTPWWLAASLTYRLTNSELRPQRDQEEGRAINCFHGCELVAKMLLPYQSCVLYAPMDTDRR